jgi:hypothetical protein
MNELPSNPNFLGKAIALAADRLATGGAVGLSMASASALRTLRSTGLPAAIARGLTFAAPFVLAQAPIYIPTLTARHAHEQTTCVQANHSLISEPWRLMRAIVGETRGEAGLSSARSTAQARKTGDLNNRFHEAEIAVKQIPKCPIYWAFYKISMKANVLKPMATVSNHRLCGEGCGENCGSRKEASNG